MLGWPTLSRRAGHVQLRQVTRLRQVSTTEDGEAEKESGDKLYRHHIPTSAFQKLFLAGGSALVGLADPWRADMVAVSGEVTASLASLKNIQEKMLADQEGRAVLLARPRITSSILPELAALPPNTLGYHYQAFMAKQEITPDSRAEVSFVDCPDLAYVMTRYRETHDLTHCILGMPTTMAGRGVRCLFFLMMQCFPILNSMRFFVRLAGSSGDD